MEQCNKRERFLRILTGVKPFCQFVQPLPDIQAVLTQTTFIGTMKSGGGGSFKKIGRTEPIHEVIDAVTLDVRFNDLVKLGSILLSVDNGSSIIHCNFSFKCYKV